MSGRQSTSDASSILSDATTIVAATDRQPPGKTAQDHDREHGQATAAANQQRRGLRQKARDLLSDMGSPPTKRQDAKDGKHTSNFADLGMLPLGGLGMPSRT
jgi:hypothetical protein